MKKLFLLLFLLLPLNVFATSLPVDVTNMDIAELQKAREKKYFTYEKLTKVFLERIEKYNNKYNAFTNINEDALKIAKNLDIEYKKHGRRSMIMGMPIVISNNINYVKFPTTSSVSALNDNYVNKNASVVQKLIDKGAIIIGSANTSEFNIEDDLYKSSNGYTTNAYNFFS